MIIFHCFNYNIILYMCSVLDNALLSTVEELQSALDRAKEKLQSNNSLLIDKEKQISKLSTDIDTVSIRGRSGRQGTDPCLLN